MWDFCKANYKNTIQESKLDEFFSGKLSEALIREAFQNSLDAALPNGDPVRVKLTFGQANTASFPEGYDELFEHWKARDSKFVPKPTYPFLLIEDFNTKGLEGPLSKTSAPRKSLYGFWWAEGRSQDKKTGSGGSHGVGKSTLSNASSLKAFLALTVRQDTIPEIMLGYCNLAPHKISDVEYLGYARFGDTFNDDKQGEVIYPYDAAKHEHQAKIAKFRAHAGVSRKTDSGLSIFIPAVAEEVNATSVARATILNYFLPIIKGKLVVEIHDATSGASMRIEKSTILELIDHVIEGDSERQTTHAIVNAAFEAVRIANANGFFHIRSDWEITDGTSLSSDSFTKGHVAQMGEDFEAGKMVAIRLSVPVKRAGKKPKFGYADVYLQKNAGGKAKIYRPFRGNILIEKERPSLPQPFDTLIMDVFNDDDGNELSEYLKFTEDPGHTEWKNSANRRSEGEFPEAWIRSFVKGIPSKCLAIVSGTENKEELSHFADDIFFIERESKAPKTDEKDQPHKKARAGEDNPSVPDDIPAPSPDLFTIRKQGASDVRISGTDFLRENLKANPAGKTSAFVKAAHIIPYSGKTTWFTSFNKADFDFNDDKTVLSEGAEIVVSGPNQFTFDVISGDFEILLQGFDPHRDVYVEIRPVKEVQS